MTEQEAKPVLDYRSHPPIREAKFRSAAPIGAVVIGFAYGSAAIATLCVANLIFGLSVALVGTQSRAMEQSLILGALMVGMEWVLAASGGGVFLWWVWRTCANLVHLRARPPYPSPLGAIASFLIPPLNLYWPVVVLSWTWDSSDRTRGRPPELIALWWYSYLVSLLVTPVTLLVCQESIRDWMIFIPMLVAQSSWMVAAFSGIAIIKGIDRAQLAMAWARSAMDVQGGEQVSLSAS